VVCDNVNVGMDRVLLGFVARASWIWTKADVVRRKIAAKVQIVIDDLLKDILLHRAEF
jgi:hypothetical protein